MAPAVERDFLWIAIAGGVFSFIMSFGIGANDVSHAFGPSVAARTLTLAQAIPLATVCEFSGAVGLGAGVASTVRGKILKTSVYKYHPVLFMFGNLNALVCGSTWLLIATKFQFPISTTYTIISAIIGFSLAARGFDSVDWHNASLIFVSWVAAPTFTGIISWVFVTAIYRFVLQSDDPFGRGLNVFPLVMFAGISINTAFILLQGEGNYKHPLPNFGVKVALPASVGLGLLCALIQWIIVGPRLAKRVLRQQAEHDGKEADEKAKELDGAQDDAEEGETAKNGHDDDIEVEGEVRERTAEEGEEPARAPLQKMSTVRALMTPIEYGWKIFADNTYRQDLQEISFTENSRARDIWQQDHLYDPTTERLFSYLQVLTASLNSFAHGSHDVANGVAPFSAIIDIYRYGKLNKNIPVKRWILAYGGAGICFGFLFFGYQTIKAIGYKLITMSPSRGFCIELASALAVSTSSYLSIPVSTTQCLIGATVGAGLAAGGTHYIQWWFLLRIIGGWVFFFTITCITSCGVFAYCIYSPSLVSAS